MRRRILAVIALLIQMVGFGQDSSVLKDAQGLFAEGNYSAAVTKYQEAVNTLSGRERAIAQLQMSTAKNCVEAINNAKAAESRGDYGTAILEYQKVVDANPDDTKVMNLLAHAQKADREAHPTLTINTSRLNFDDSGGSQKIIVNCSMDWTFVNPADPICSLSRNGNEITVTCLPNHSTIVRDTYFVVKTANGVKEQRVYVSQSGHSSVATKLSANQTYFYVPSKSGTITIYVTTDASDYSVFLLPSWCKLKTKTATSFSIEYAENTSTDPRHDWFKIIAGGKTLKVDIQQKGKKYGNHSSYESGSHNKVFRVGFDMTVEGYPGDNSSSYSSYDNAYLGYGIGFNARIGRYNNALNLISGFRYVLGDTYTGALVPVLLNINIPFDDGALFLGGGYEFSLSDTYNSSFMLQTGLCGDHFDFSFYVKTKIIGMGFTYYF